MGSWFTKLLGDTAGGKSLTGVNDMKFKLRSSCRRVPISCVESKIPMEVSGHRPPVKSLL